MKNLAFHSLLRWKMITLPILTTNTMYCWELGLGECWNLRVKEEGEGKGKSAQYSSGYPKQIKRYCRFSTPKSWLTTFLRCYLSFTRILTNTSGFSVLLVIKETTGVREIRATLCAAILHKTTEFSTPSVHLSGIHAMLQYYVDRYVLIRYALIRCNIVCGNIA